MFLLSLNYNLKMGGVMKSKTLIFVIVSVCFFLRAVEQGVATIGQPVKPTATFGITSSFAPSHVGTNQSRTSLSKASEAVGEVEAQSVYNPDLTFLLKAGAQDYEILKKKLAELDASPSKMPKAIPSGVHALASRINKIKSKLQGEELLEFIYAYSTPQLNSFSPNRFSSEEEYKNMLKGIEEAEARILEEEKIAEFVDFLDQLDSARSAAPTPINGVENVAPKEDIVIEIPVVEDPEEEQSIQSIIAEANKRAKEIRPYVFKGKQQKILEASRRRLREFLRQES